MVNHNSNQVSGDLPAHFLEGVHMAVAVEVEVAVVEVEGLQGS